MTAQILLHPQLTGAEAQSIAREQGGKLVWRDARVRLIKSRMHADSAHIAILNGQPDTALKHIRDARQQVAEVLP